MGRAKKEKGNKVEERERARGAVVGRYLWFVVSG